MIGEGGGSQHLFVSIAYSASESQEHIRNKLPTARTNALEKKKTIGKKNRSVSINNLDTWIIHVDSLIAW